MEKKVCNIFCDESRQDLLASSESITDTNRFSCIGGIMVPALSRERIKGDIEKIQKKYNTYGELKWGTVSSSRIDFYLELIDYFFCENEISFRTVVIDSSKINNEVYNDSDQELGYYKFYYQLLYHWIDPQDAYRIYTDQKTNGDRMRLKVLRNILNNSYPYSSPVESIQSINSKEAVILQLENVLMGAVGYKYNFGRSGKSKAKRLVVNRIEQHLHREICPTIKSEAKFNVFEILLRGGC